MSLIRAERRPPTNTGERLRSLREDVGLSLGAMATLCLMRTSELSDIELGKRKVTEHTLRRMLEAIADEAVRRFKEEHL